MRKPRHKVQGLATALTVLAICILPLGCETVCRSRQMEWNDRRFAQAIASGHLDEADQMLAEFLAEAGGGVLLEGILCKRALLNAKMGRYGQAKSLVDEVIDCYPGSPYRDTALCLREWIEKHEDAVQPVE